MGTTASPTLKDRLCELEDIVCSAQMLCEGMRPANCQMGDRQYINASSGAFGAMAYALEDARQMINGLLEGREEVTA